MSYSNKVIRSISAKKELEEYEKELSEVLRLLEKTADNYPDDIEIKKISDRFSSFYAARHEGSVDKQKEKVSNFIGELKSLVHWRKMETAYGKTLGFSDFRSLRSESKKR